MSKKACVTIIALIAMGFIALFIFMSPARPAESGMYKFSDIDYSKLEDIITGYNFSQYRCARIFIDIIIESNEADKWLFGWDNSKIMFLELEQDGDYFYTCDVFSVVYNFPEKDITLTYPEFFRAMGE